MSLPTILLFLCVYTGQSAEVRPSPITRKFQNSIQQQNLQTILTSIEERLRNLDNVYSLDRVENRLEHNAQIIDGKFEHFSRKLDGVESKLVRLEALVRDGFTERNFVLEKLDSVHDRIRNRLDYAEIKIEMAERKLENKLEIILAKLEKIEEDVSASDANAAMEFADVIAALDDGKASTDSIENKIDSLINPPVVTSADKNLTGILTDEIRNEFNNFANKVVDFHDSSWKSYHRVENGIKNVATLANLTRYEIQNGFRSLVLEVARKQNAGGVLSDCPQQKDEAEILSKMDRKIDSNFESIMLAQNLFLESCYRLQKDEPQLETKISQVLEKLIDTFEQKTSLQPKDIENLEQLIRSHDFNVRASSSSVAEALLKKVDVNGRKTQENLGAFRNTIEQLYLLMQSKFGLYDENKLDEIISVLKDVKTHLLAIDAQLKQDAGKNHSLGETEIQGLKTVLDQLQNMTRTSELEHIRDIYRILSGIELKLSKSYLDYYFNKYNVEAIARRFGTLLDSYLRNFTQFSRNETTDFTGNQTEINANRTRLIMEIFGGKPKTNCSSIPLYDIDIRYGSSDSSTDNCSDSLSHPPIYDIDLRYLTTNKNASSDETTDVLQDEDYEQDYNNN